LVFLNFTVFVAFLRAWCLCILHLLKDGFHVKRLDKRFDVILMIYIILLWWCDAMESDECMDNGWKFGWRIYEEII